MPRLPMLVALVLISATAGLRAEEPEAAPSAEALRFFEAKVRPVLADNCLKCHGPDKQKSGLRLDSKAAAMAGGELGPAVVPGKPDESLLVAAVRHDDDAPKMPPSKKLAKEQVDDLTRWVQMGAPWPGGDGDGPAPAKTAARKGPMVVTDKDRAHWAFQPVRRPPLPVASRADWGRNPIDAFVLAGLDASGLEPNPPADRHELIRRATYDLTGLPPTPSEVAAFLNDDRSDAYERLVDRLLALPAYGERWGRHWLDLVRFAETNSYERDNPKPSAWRFRDYVIQSFNADNPYDRFVREQLAGDELPDGGDDGLIATGYYRLGIWDDEPSDRETARYDGLDDLVATTGQVFLGLTVDCARCHDHKIDPIPQKDYYRLLAFFQNINHFRNGGPTDEAPLTVAPADEDEYQQKVRERKQQIEQGQAAVDAIEQQFRQKADLGGPAPAHPPDLADLHYRFYRDTWEQLPDFDALKPEESGDLPGRLFDLAPRSRDDAFGFVFEGELVVPAAGTYTFHLDSDDGSRLRIHGRVVVEHDGVHGTGSERTGTVELAAGRVPIRLDYFQRADGLGLYVAWSGPGIERRRLSAPPAERDRPKLDLARLIRADGARVLGAETYRAYVDLQRRLKRLREQKVPRSTALCVTEAGPAAPPTHVLIRGNAHVPGDEVGPGFLQVLGGADAAVPTPSESARTTGRRSALADWIASADNPMTARVMANRVWQFHFGRGIVRSPSNFGTQGDRPTHPELLDWLAAELVADGWRLKPLHRQIMTSRTYQMSSRGRAEALAKDPQNDRLWRFDMRRLSAEEVRDSILAVSGQLNPKMGGQGVYPTMPAAVLASQSVPGKGWGQSPPQEQARRSVYVHVKRSLLYPLLESFDLAETDRSTPARFSTTQPTQALAMLNGDFLNAQAAALADRLEREAGPDVRDQVRLALRLVTGREPSGDEVGRGVSLTGELAERYHLSPAGALRAFALVALNLNEFLYLD